ncbi:hypothetical protein CC80DRAFT_542487 [Byssothecium circinans]|uniref:Uncharacterized protein n=1 Tax=Byssothecium circinans TaxID=147558 RepID=A0A6A5UCX9_9PLEO|nr:hypothetical protein CC80DRAFT_542487 [Byssothecium circinans]
MRKLSHGVLAAKDDVTERYGLNRGRPHNDWDVPSIAIADYGKTGGPELLGTYWRQPHAGTNRQLWFSQKRQTGGHRGATSTAQHSERRQCQPCALEGEPQCNGGALEPCCPRVPACIGRRRDSLAPIFFHDRNEMLKSGQTGPGLEVVRLAPISKQRALVSGSQWS